MHLLILYGMLILAKSVDKFLVSFATLSVDSISIALIVKSKKDWIKKNIIKI